MFSSPSLSSGGMEEAAEPSPEVEGGVGLRDLVRRLLSGERDLDRDLEREWLRDERDPLLLLDRDLE